MGNEKFYLDKETEKIWDGLKQEIEKQFDGKSKFFQHFIRSFDGKGQLESRLHLKKMQLKEARNRVKQLEAEVEGLEERIENGDADEIEEMNGFGEDPREHEKYEKAIRILSEKHEESRTGLSPENRYVKHWANTLGVKPEQMLELVHDELTESSQEGAPA